MNVQGHYSWDASLDSRIRQIWERKSGKAYNDNLSAARTRAITMCKQNGHQYDENDSHRDLDLLKPYNPSWLSPVLWNALIDLWNNDHWKDVSVVSRANRLTEVDGDISKHTNGSISFAETAARLAKKKGGVHPTGLELFDHTHKKRRSGEDSSSSESGEYVTSRCSRVTLRYQTGVIEKYGENPVEHPPLDTQLWHEVTGGTRKGRSFGFGPDPNAFYCGSSSGGASSSSQQQIVENLMAEVKELKEREEVRKREEEVRKREEEDRRQEEEDKRREEEACKRKEEDMRREEEDRRHEKIQKQYDEMCDLVKSLSQNLLRPPSPH